MSESEYKGSRIKKVLVSLPDGETDAFTGDELHSCDWGTGYIWLTTKAGVNHIYEGMPYYIERKWGEAPTHLGRQGY